MAKLKAEMKKHAAPRRKNAAHGASAYGKTPSARGENPSEAKAGFIRHSLRSGLNPRPFKANARPEVFRGRASRGSLAGNSQVSKKRKKPPSPKALTLIPIRLADEIRPGDSLADKLLESLRRHRLRLRPGDILIVKHKIVSKSERRIVDLTTIHPSDESIAWAKQYALDARVVELALRESRSVIRRKNGALITETHHGFLCANSGVDVSNVDGGHHAILLPEDPDRSAANLRRAIKKRTGLSIPVIITDSFGRPWREGLTEFAIGIAGMKPLRDDRGLRDPDGYQLKASVEAVADELACAAGLVCGKLNRTPACIVRGFRYDPGQGSAQALLRPASTDLFR